MIIKAEEQKKHMSLLLNKFIKILIFVVCLLFLFLINTGCGEKSAENKSNDNKGVKAEDKSEYFDNEYSNTKIQDTKSKLKPKAEELKWEWLVMPTEYEDVYFVDTNLIAVKAENEKYGVINLDKELVIPFEYTNISKFYNDISKAEKDGEIYFINKKGEPITNISFEEAYSFSEEYAAIKKDNKWGFIDKKGNIAIENEYEEVKAFKENLAAVKKDNKWGFIDKNGKAVIENQFEEVKDFKESLAAVKKYNKWGYIDKNGKVCVDLKYDEVGNFSEGKAAVKINKYKDNLDHWAYIDVNGNIVIEYYPYSATEGRMVVVSEFKNGLAFVAKDLYCIIDDKGNDVFLGESKFFINADFSYDVGHDTIPAYVYADDMMRIKKYGYMGLKGNRRLAPQFDYIYGLQGDYAIVENIINGEYKKGIIKVIE